ncbi:hypothetical protein BKP35_06070 [Anaerobacillus arseniciselenatis]|uniref:Uncharacterized protein n=1 Tax=Anaerobacillus arseniciselenatis TaxID=85682 RepID=A0A1S2LR66_9BACI|nr:hypothetical protein BKP35_06070 [Anaerobacillus arseniciselenatis]
MKVSLLACWLGRVLALIFILDGGEAVMNVLYENDRPDFSSEPLKLDRGLQRSERIRPAFTS